MDPGRARKSFAWVAEVGAGSCMMRDVEAVEVAVADLNKKTVVRPAEVLEAAEFLAYFPAGS